MEKAERNQGSRTWIVSLRAANWEIVHEHGVVGFTKRWRKSVMEMSVGDRLVFYLAGEKQMAGIYTIISSMYEDDSPLWKDDVYPLRVRIEPLPIEIKQEIVTRIPVTRPLVERLEFVKNKEFWTLHFKGARPRPLSPEDAATVYAALSKGEILEERREEETKLHLERIDFLEKEMAKLEAETKRLREQSGLEVTTDLANELVSLSRQGPQWKQFEQAVQEAFISLGFVVKPFGEADETDLLINSETFSAIVDAKSRSRGSLSRINTARLKRHKEKYNAKFIVVVGPAFDAGVINDAQREGITLLTAQSLATLLRTDGVCFYAFQLQPVFECHGLADGKLQQLVSSLRGEVELRLRVFQAVAKLESLGLAEAQIGSFARSLNMSPKECRDILIELASPLLGVLVKEGDIYYAPPAHARFVERILRGRSGILSEYLLT